MLTISTAKLKTMTITVTPVTCKLVDNKIVEQIWKSFRCLAGNDQDVRMHELCSLEQCISEFRMKTIMFRT